MEEEIEQNPSPKNDTQNKQRKPLFEDEFIDMSFLNDLPTKRIFEKEEKGI